MGVSKNNNQSQIIDGDLNDDSSKFKGVHLILELYKCNKEKLNDELFLRCAITNAAKLAKSKVLNLVSNKFEPQGVTAIALLAESHLSIHTWPESRYAAVDIYTCGKNMRPDLASKFLIESLDSKNNLIKTLNRNYPKTIESLMRRL